MRYSCFVDETGDHGLDFIEDNFPLFLLCACVIRQGDLVSIAKRVNDFKLKHFGNTDVILQSHGIRRHTGAFHFLADPDQKVRFYADLGRVLGDSPYCLVAVCIEKRRLIKKYGEQAADPYSLSLSLLLERIVKYVRATDVEATVWLVLEERGKLDDEVLHKHTDYVIAHGTYYVPGETFTEVVHKVSFYKKADNLVGLQIADLCAYPLARYILNPRRDNLTFKVIEPKLYANEQGDYDGWGLKRFP